jgi:hypothetical protein
MLIGDATFRSGDGQLSTDVRPVAGYGVTVTPAVGSKGSWSAAMTLAADCFGLWITICNNNVSASSRNSVLDVGIDPAGGSSYSVLVPDLLCGNARSYTGAAGAVGYFFPVFLRAGTSIAIRAQSTVTTAFQAQVRAQKGSRHAWGRGVISKVIPVGLNLPGGTAFTPGSTSEGSWTSLGTTARDLWFWQLGLQINSTITSMNGSLYHVDLAWGDASNKRMIMSDVPFIVSNAELHGLNPQSFFDGMEPVPGGAGIYVRGWSSGTVNNIEAVAYGGT